MRDINQRPLCHRAEDLVSYLYGDANDVDAADFRRHLQQCDACRSEFTVFNQVHESIVFWRNEALGASFNPATVVSESTIDSKEFVEQGRKLSALAARREFFTVSPVWLRGATAFAGLLLCALVLFGVGVYSAVTLVGDWRRSGLKMLVIGLGAAGIGFLIGNLFHGAGG